MRDIRQSGSMSVAPCKRVELSRLRWRRQQSLASSRVPSLAWRPVTAAAKRRQGGLEHIGLTVDDVDAAVAELRAKGAEIAIGPLTRNPGLRLAFVRGPEGIMMELVER